MNEHENAINGELNKYFERFGYACCDTGAFAKTQRIAVASELIFGWFECMLWRAQHKIIQFENEEEGICLNACCAPIAVTTNRPVELALAVLGMPQEQVKPVMESFGENLKRIIDACLNEGKDADFDEIEKLSKRLAESVWDTAAEIRDIRFKNPVDVDKN